MNINVPSHEPGASSLPAELRIARGDNETVHGYDRLSMGQRTPVGNRYGWTRGTGNPHGVSGMGADPTLIPVDPVPVPPIIVPAFKNLPPTASQQAVDAVNKVNSMFGSNAAAVIARVLANFPPNVVPAAVASLQRWLATRTVAPMGTMGVSGLQGMGDYATDTGYVPTTDTSIVLPPSVYQDPTLTSVPTTTAGTDINWAQIIGSSTSALTNLVAVTQGGSVSAGPGGTTVQGSPGGALMQAQIPANQLNVSGAGVSGILSSPMLLLLIGGGLLLVMSSKR